MIKSIKKNRLSQLTIQLIDILDKSNINEQVGIFDNENYHLLFDINHSDMIISPRYNNIVLIENIPHDDKVFFFPDRPTSGIIFDKVNIAIANSKYSDYTII